MNVLVAIVTLLVFVACSDVQFVDRVEVENPTDYDARVEVRGDDDGWVALATVTAKETKAVGYVIDQGPAWIFRFSYAGHQVEAAYERSALVEAGWRVEVPPAFEEELGSAGVQPPP